METHCGIPVIDLQGSLAEKEIAANLVSAFASVGFAYIKNHEIEQPMVDEVLTKAANFFDLPREVKMKYRHPIEENKPAFGFTPPEDEIFFENQPVDIKECLDVFMESDFKKWPSDDDVPGFQPVVSAFVKKLENVGFRLLKLVGLGLNMDDPDFYATLSQSRKDMQFRMADYPKISELSKIKSGQLRCSEHTDYGGLTILFQDDCGGLEVRNVAGDFVEAVPMKGTALVNVGDFIAMCTGGRLKSTPHRVLVSEKNFYKRRQSLVFFCDPDGERVVQPSSSPRRC